MYVLFDEHKTWKSNNSATESEEPGEFRVEFGTFGNQCLRDNDWEPKFALSISVELGKIGNPKFPRGSG